MTTSEQIHEAHDAEQSRPVTITVQVNNQPVAFHTQHVTGAEIKSTAIAQGVAIQPDFVLYEALPGGKLKQIADTDRIALHPRQSFRAVAPDDNS